MLLKDRPDIYPDYFRKSAGILDSLTDAEFVAVLRVATELQRAKAKHPGWPTDPIHAAAIVAEEAGELCRAALGITYEQESRHEMHKEAVHTGATALRFLSYEYHPTSTNQERPQA